MDTRFPELQRWAAKGCDAIQISKKQSADLITLTYFLNVEYARANGYDLIFYRSQRDASCAKNSTKCEVGCRHPTWGARHPSYCKLAGLGDALRRGYEWVVYLDSDAFVANLTLPLPKLLQAYGADADAAEGAPSATHHGFFGWDWPYTLGPNMGFMALRNTAEVRRMMSTWWNLFAGPYSIEHPMEQHTMQWQLMHLDRFRRRVQTLSLHTMDPSVVDAVVHLDHNAGTKNRLWVTARAIAEVLCARRAP
eukprot:2944009-Prymnesium_polylepis.1